MASKAEAGGTNRIMIPLAKTVDTSKKAIKWFVDRVKVAIKNTGLGSADKRLKVGHLYLYRYDPKHKATLPYYDSVPLMIPIKYYPDGVLGLNLHYLPQSMRTKLLDMLTKSFGSGNNENMYLRISYDKLNALSKAKMFAPCIKRYLYSHMKTPPTRIPHSEWQNASLLPTAKFIGASASQVHRDSLLTIRGK